MNSTAFPTIVEPRRLADGGTISRSRHDQDLHLEAKRLTDPKYRATQHSVVPSPPIVTPSFVPPPPTRSETLDTGYDGPTTFPKMDPVVPGPYLRMADGGALRAGQDAYGASIQQVKGGDSVPPPPEKGAMSQTEFNRRGPAPDADKVKAQQEQLRKLLEARGVKPVGKACGGDIHHLVASHLIHMAEGGTVDYDAHDAAHSPHNDLPEPTERQRASGNYVKGHTNINGLHVTIENPAGSKRRKEWPTMSAHYGYATGGTPSSDGDHVDVFVKPGTPLDHSGPVHVIDQLHPNGTHDEPKAMVGYPDKDAASAAYLSHYSPGWSGIGAVTAMSHDKFKDWVRDGVKSAPVARKAFTRAEGGDYLCTGGLTT